MLVLDRNEEMTSDMLCSREKANKESNGSEMMAMPLLMYRIYIECARKEAKLSYSMQRYMHTMLVFVLYVSLVHTDAHIGIRATTLGSHPVDTGIRVCVYLYVCLLVCLRSTMMMILFVVG